VPDSNVTPPPPPSGDDSVAFGAQRLRRYFLILRQRLLIILAIVATGVTATALYTLQQKKIYAATATFVVNPSAPRVFGNEEEVIELGANSYWSNKEFYNTQLDILTRFPLAHDTVIKKHGDVPFYDELAPKDAFHNLSEEERIDHAADLLMTMLHPTQNRESRVFAITVDNTDPELARALANAHVQSYLAATLAKRTRGADKSSKFLSTELDLAATALRDSEQKLYEFKEKNDIISVSLEDKQSILAQDIARYSAALADSRIKRIDLAALRTRAEGLKGEDVLESPVFALASNSATVDILKQSYVAEKQKFLEIGEEYGPKSTTYIQQKKKVDDLYAQIEGEARRSMRELEERYQATIASENAFHAEVERLKTDALALGPLQVTYNDLIRQNKSAEESYNQLASRLRASTHESHNEQINVDELEYARTAHKVSPRMHVNIVIAFVLSLGFAIGLAFLLDYMDRTVKTVEQVESAVGAPMLGVIPIVAEAPAGDDPKAQVERDLYVYAHPTSRAAECCRSIRTNILFSSADRPMKTITVSSPRPREGKTTTTIYLGTAMAQAQSGGKVLLIDTDLRRPRLHKSLGINKQVGLTNLILGDATMDEVIKTTEIPNLYVLPSGPQPPNPAELLLTNRFKQVLADLEPNFDRILLDSPPVLAVTDAVVLSRLTSGVIIVAQAGKSTLDDVSNAARQFKDVNAPILGVILNDLDISDRRYGDYYYRTYGTYGEPAGGEAA
jgi:capsular exopolysaccharide synthesis family protein